jgi:hypothetical protein
MPTRARSTWTPWKANEKGTATPDAVTSPVSWMPPPLSPSPPDPSYSISTAPTATVA